LLSLVLLLVFRVPCEQDFFPDQASWSAVWLLLFATTRRRVLFPPFSTTNRFGLLALFCPPPSLFFLLPPQPSYSLATPVNKSVLFLTKGGPVSIHPWPVCDSKYLVPSFSPSFWKDFLFSASLCWCLWDTRGAGWSALFFSVFVCCFVFRLFPSRFTHDFAPFASVSRPPLFLAYSLFWLFPSLPLVCSLLPCLPRCFYPFAGAKSLSFTILHRGFCFSPFQPLFMPSSKPLPLGVRNSSLLRFAYSVLAVVRSPAFL